MKTRISTPWPSPGDLHRLAKIILRRLLLTPALCIITLPAAAATNYALSFDGFDDRVQAGTNLFSTVANNFTIELWANPTGTRGATAETVGGISGFGSQRFAVFPDHGDFGYGPGGHAGVGLSIGSNGISVFEHRVNHLPSVLVYTNAISGWTHVALVYLFGTPQLYVNGTLVRTGLTSTNAYIHPSASLGGSVQGMGYGNYQGQLDEVRIWDVPLSESQIQANMNRTLADDEPNLVVYFRCDEGTGLALPDHAPAVPNVNGTLVNGTAYILSGVLPFTPWVETLATTGVTGTAATLNGVANPKGANTSVWFEWGTNELSFGNITSAQTVGSGADNVNFSHSLNGLVVNTTYYVRAFASSSLGVAYGNGQSFTTGPAAPPTVQTLPASFVGPTMASLNSMANPNGTNTSCWFEWGLTTNYSNVTTPIPVGSGVGPVGLNQGIVNLATGVSYHFRAVASNGLGVALGSNLSFTTPVFTDINAGLPGVAAGSAAWGDYDSDGRLDILLTGTNVASGIISQVWRNNGSGSTNIYSLTYSDGSGGSGRTAGAWGDYDNDGRLDFLLAGFLLSDSTLFRNTGSGFAVLSVGLESDGLVSASVAWGDYNNDGRSDIWVTGESLNAQAISRLWRNTGNGFTNSIVWAVLPGSGSGSGSVAWGDYDNDGWLDFVLTGPPFYSQPLWRNTGSAFTNLDFGLPAGDVRGAVAWGDYDNDGRLDILMTGTTNALASGALAQVWRNTANGFTNLNTGLPGVEYSSAAWGDYDNDGRLDILLTGTTNGTVAGAISQVWRNTGSGFTNINAGLPGVFHGSGAWGDYDNDGRLDILVTGSNATAGAICQIWRNNTPVTNTPPSAPTGLAAAVTGSMVTLSWNAANDAQTSASGLTYNLRVGTTPGAGDVFSPMSAANGFRRLPQTGNAQTRLFARLNVTVGTPYFWSVQAVDSSFAGSAFAAEGDFKLLQWEAPLIVTPAAATGLLVGDYNGNGVIDEGELNTVLSNYFPNSPFLQMTNVAGLGGTNVTFGLSNATTGAFSVEVTTNLLDWLFLGPATPRYEFTDTNAPAIPQRFYRLRWP